MAAPPIPERIGPVPIPQDEASRAAWHLASRRLPTYLFAHSVRTYGWAAELGRQDALAFDARLLWIASVLHDIGLTRLGRTTRCFEVEGAQIARRSARASGLTPDDAERVARAIVLHMAPAVTIADGVESLLLDRATAVDVRHVDASRLAAMRGPIDEAYPRGAFDRLFRAAIAREVAIRGDCPSAGLLQRLPP